MRRFVYVSEAYEPFDADGLTELLTGSRKRNEEVGLTGMLLYRNQRFMQVLEGPGDALQETVNRIMRDPRHGSFCVLADQQVSDRLFADWSMAFAVPRGERAAQQPGFSHFLTDMFDPRPLLDDPTFALDLLTAFKNQEPSEACAA